MRMLHGRVSCFKCMNMNEQEHELELEQHKKELEHKLVLEHQVYLILSRRPFAL